MSFSLKGFKRFRTPAFGQMQELIDRCQHTQQTLLLGFSDLAEFKCAQTGDCCHEWNVPISQTYYEQWQAEWNRDPKSSFYEPFIIKETPTPEAYAHLRKVDNHCVFLTDDKRCHIHTTYGLEAKPLGCQYFPHNAHVNPNAYSVVYLEKACNQGFNAHMHPLYRLVPYPKHQEKPLHICYQVPLDVSHQWLAMVWDTLAQSPSSPIHTLQQLGLGLHILGEHQWRFSPSQMQQLYALQFKQLSAQKDRVLPLPSRALQEWAIAFFQIQGLELKSVFESSPRLSVPQKKEFNDFIRVFLNYKVSTQLYAHPFHGPLTHCQHAVVMAVELYVLQVYLLYLLEKQTPYQAALRRALIWAERKLGHTTDWLYSLGVHQWEDAQCLNQFYVFLDWDLGA